MSHFPMAIWVEGAEALRLAETVEDLPVGLSFRVILTRITAAQFALVDEAVKNVVRCNDTPNSPHGRRVGNQQVPKGIIPPERN